MSSEGKQNRLGASDGRFLQNPSSYKSKESGREYQHQGQLRNRSDHQNIVVASEYREDPNQLLRFVQEESDRPQENFSRNFNTMEKGKNNSTTNKNRSSVPPKFSFANGQSAKLVDAAH